MWPYCYKLEGMFCDCGLYRNIIYIIFSGSAAQCGLWPPVALQPSTGYGLLWLCSPAWAMASCGSAAQCGLWPPVALQPSVGYGLLWLCSPARAVASCGSAAQRRLWPPVALQPSAGHGLLWLCSQARAMASSFTRFRDHTRRTTVSRCLLDKWSARRRDLYLTTHNTHNKHPCPRWDSSPWSQQASGHRPTP
jgi:hypothetical protein